MYGTALVSITGHVFQGQSMLKHYINDVLQLIVIPKLKTYRLQVFQHDNVRVHTAQATQAFLQQHMKSMLWAGWLFALHESHSAKFKAGMDLKSATA
ncbi:hypothetical protein PoB_004833900 [Plakobranchus ocellatus]|uniref:Transposase n=1 Tax=Plakobranchus ocellatus TaxID=259542 RepID=A0AAV4BSN9_9GAST|nr:hypothetical protein PoB_004833900 [Plakobranchus ocellatus]